MEKLYTVNEICTILHMSRDSVYRFMREGRLRYVIVGARRRVPQSALNTFIAESGTEVANRNKQRTPVAAAP